MDAAIMDGRDLSAGAVALIQSTKNPVRLAGLLWRRLTMYCSRERGRKIG